jgi:PAP2 superfamily
VKKISLFVGLLLYAASATTKAQNEPQSRGANNVAYKWGAIALDCTGNDTERFKPRPTVTSRYLGLVWTAVFDAWSRYDNKANPVYLKAPRRPASERTLRNKEIAISYAAYRAMMTYFFSDSLLLKKAMTDMGLDPENTNLSPATPAGIGNLAATTVIKIRMHDGSNQAGDENGSNGEAYADYTNYKPINSADQLTDLKHWQPKYFADGKGGKFCPSCLTPQWGKVQPLMLKSPQQFRPGAPPALGSAQLETEVKEVVELQANLTNQQKALVEFMRDGPKSVQQAGHWFIFAQDVSRRDQHTLDEDVKMYFVVQAAAMDAFIACWDAKMEYDFARPYSLVHDYYKNKKIKMWGGQSAGFIEADGQEWRPYSPETFLCPPFPSYVSGHSTVSGACAEILRRYTGSDYLGEKVQRVPGALTEPEHVGDTVTLSFPTFTETANMAGISRVLGGYHIQCENVEGLKLGRNVADAVWKKYLVCTGDIKGHD